MRRNLFSIPIHPTFFLYFACRQTVAWEISFCLNRKVLANTSLLTARKTVNHDLIHTIVLTETMLAVIIWSLFSYVWATQQTKDSFEMQMQHFHNTVPIGKAGLCSNAFFILTFYVPMFAYVSHLLCQDQEVRFWGWHGWQHGNHFIHTVFTQADSHSSMWKRRKIKQLVSFHS